MQIRNIFCIFLALAFSENLPSIIKAVTVPSAQVTNAVLKGIMNNAKVFPGIVSGTMSPYPTVKTVTMVSRKASNNVISSKKEKPMVPTIEIQTNIKDKSINERYFSIFSYPLPLCIQPFLFYQKLNRVISFQFANQQGLGHGLLKIDSSLKKGGCQKIRD